MMTKNSLDLITDMRGLYEWLDQQVAAMGQSCNACGDCCDFERFGHRLYLTGVELAYFTHHLGPELKPMNSGVCPYRINGKCAAYPYRFAGCRIFSCTGDDDQQSALCEHTLAQCKTLGQKHHMPYLYQDLRSALNTPTATS